MSKRPQGRPPPERSPPLPRTHRDVASTRARGGREGRHRKGRCARIGTLPLREHVDAGQAAAGHVLGGEAAGQASSSSHREAASTLVAGEAAAGHDPARGGRRHQARTRGHKRSTDSKEGFRRRSSDLEAPRRARDGEARRRTRGAKRARRRLPATSLITAVEHATGRNHRRRAPRKDLVTRLILC